MFFSSHQLSEVERIADHIGIIEQGKLVVSGCLDDLKSQYQRLELVLPDAVQPDGVENVRRKSRVVSILASHNVEAIVDQARALPGTALQRFPVTLKEIFLEHVRTN